MKIHQGLILSYRRLWPSVCVCRPHIALRLFEACGRIKLVFSLQRPAPRLTYVFFQDVPLQHTFCSTRWQVLLPLSQRLWAPSVSLGQDNFSSVVYSGISFLAYLGVNVVLNWRGNWSWVTADSQFSLDCSDVLDCCEPSQSEDEKASLTDTAAAASVAKCFGIRLWWSRLKVMEVKSDSTLWFLQGKVWQSDENRLFKMA